MAKLTLVESKKGGSTAASMRSDMAHRAAPTEGDAVKELMESQGYLLVRQSKDDYEFACPFCGEPGKPKKGPFYVNRKTSKYYCQAVGCLRKGNLTTLERHFGLTNSDDPKYVGMEARLQTYQAALTPDRRQVFYEHGLLDTTIDRFRLGFDVQRNRYVIPYLDGNRPVLFRYYNPTPGIGSDGKPELKYYWEKGSDIQLFNKADCVGDSEGTVFVAEGELKAMILWQIGYAAVACPGAGAFKEDWVKEFYHARNIRICFDNDNPAFHKKKLCQLCGTQTEEECQGHNPGQEGALRLMEMLGWKAKNVLLPRLDTQRKTDINEYFTRDGHTAAEFAELALGKKSSFIVRSFADIMNEPPEETKWLIDNVLPVGGRLLVTGAPKVGKSIFIEDLCLALTTGVPFLRRFNVDHPTRVLLLDRELSKRSFYDRISSFVEDRLGYKAGLTNLLVDHDHMIKLDQPGALEILTQLVEMNGAEVVVFDTAYKFFTGDIESSKGVSKVFDTLDMLIKQTGVSIILTHHHRKGQAGQKEGPSPDQVVGSFLWTGWPNGTILLNFAKDRVREPFTTICSFTAFRDCAPPEPLILKRDREHISYQSVAQYVPDEGGYEYEGGYGDKPTADSIAAMLVENAPMLESDFIEMAHKFYKCKPITIKTILLDILDTSDNYVRIGRGTPDSPYVLRMNTVAPVETTWEEEHSGQELEVNQLSIDEVSA